MDRTKRTETSDDIVQVSTLRKLVEGTSSRRKLDAKNSVNIFA